LGFFPQEEDFLELTEEQYDEFYKQQGYTEERIFALLPQDPRNQCYDDFEGLCVVTEHQKYLLNCGVQLIDKICKDFDKKFDTDHEKMKFAAKYCPTEFTDGTAYEQKVDKNGNRINTKLKAIE
jgi:hypothetical protein